MINLDEILNSFKWIKVKSFKEENFSSIEEKYEALKKQHVEETEFLIKK